MVMADAKLIVCSQARLILMRGGCELETALSETGSMYTCRVLWMFCTFTDAFAENPSPLAGLLTLSVCGEG